MSTDLILQQPGGAGATELLLLFHGVGSHARDLAPLGQALARHRPRAFVVSVDAPDPSDFGQGRQWFSVQGVTEANRPERVAAAMPRFLQRVAQWQARSGVAPACTALVGFSQGAIMALESTQVDTAPAAGRVVALAGRFAQPPRRAPVATVVNLLHGEQDRVMPVALADDAHRALQALGATATIDRFSGLGHGIDARVLEAILRRWPPDSAPDPDGETP